jgi:hypothetical protein
MHIEMNGIRGRIIGVGMTYFMDTTLCSTNYNVSIYRAPRVTISFVFL